MKALIETTIQINRIFKSKKKLELENGCVVTSNESDYEPICWKIGAQLTVIK